MSVVTMNFQTYLKSSLLVSYYSYRTCCSTLNFTDICIIIIKFVFLLHLIIKAVIRFPRNLKNGLSELMVNFVTSSYKPELLKPLVERVSAIPEVVCLAT